MLCDYFIYKFFKIKKKVKKEYFLTKNQTKQKYKTFSEIKFHYYIFSNNGKSFLLGEIGYMEDESMT